LPTRVAEASTTAQYGHNTEFGDPTDADSSDDYIVRHEQYTSSYNPNRNTPNWVSYDLDASHFGGEDRCDCFTMDPDLPSTFTHLTTADYTGAGDYHGYGIDRGHLARSFDRTTGSLDNARTFLFDNIIPQAADQNQGPWAAFETWLGDQARFDDREVYIVAGVAGDKGTLKNEGKIVIPAQTWKVALLLPRDRGLADVVDYRDVQAIAVIMPNDPGVRNTPWETYETTIDAVEALSGYDLFAALPDEAEAAIESNTQPPLAAVSGPGAALNEGDTASFSAAASVDGNGAIASFAWDFGDGASGEGENATHTYANDGDFTVRVTVTDADGLTDSATVVVHVHNVAPTVPAIPNANVNVAANYTLAGSFTDPGADAWTGRVNWGDGSTSNQALSGNTFSFLHSFAAAGTYTVTVEVADDDEVTTRTLTVTVSDPSPGLAAAIPLIEQLVAQRKIHGCLGNLLKAEVRTAQMLIARGKKPAAISLLKGMVAELDLMVRYRLVKASDVAPLRTVLVQAIRSLGG
jgi:DNA/RNA endonuclease G (NUC1)